MDIFIYVVLACLGVGTIATLAAYAAISSDEEPKTAGEGVTEKFIEEIGDFVIPIVGGYVAGKVKDKFAPSKPKPKRQVPPRKQRIWKALAYGYGGTLAVTLGLGLILGTFMGALWLMNTLIGGLAGMVFCLAAVPIIFLGVTGGTIRILNRLADR